MALSCIPDDELQEKAQQQVHEARSRGETLAEQDAMAKQLLEWFKHGFFTWVGIPLLACCFMLQAPYRHGSVVWQGSHCADPHAIEDCRVLVMQSK